MEKKISRIVGIDEAGRGPLAGPVAVGVVIVPAPFDWSILPLVNDSKQLREEIREVLFEQTKKLAEAGQLQFTVSMVSAPVIDRIGIVKAVERSIARGLKKLDPDPLTTHVKLDGLLKAPRDFVYQETIVKGDAKEKVIGLASILAKVTRDRYMVKMAKKYPQYLFDAHKGYGTKKHIVQLKNNGLCVLHRRSYVKNMPYLHDVN